MKRLLLISFIALGIALSLHQNIHAQIGPPGLSVGTDEVLFNKGVLDVDLIADIIAEKQNELKQELAKRAILNSNLSDGPYLTYHYASQVITALLDHQDKNVIKKELLESTTEIAIVLAITEAYLKIDHEKISELEIAYLNMMGDYTRMKIKKGRYDNRFKGMVLLESKKYTGRAKLATDVEKKLTELEGDEYYPHDLIDADQNFQANNNLLFPNSKAAKGLKQTRNTNRFEESILTKNTTKSGSGSLPKIFDLYKMKDLGAYRGYYFYTYLNHILIDMIYEICRKNENLQRLGFFQKKFDELAFQQRSKFRMILHEIDNDEKLSKIFGTKSDQAAIDTFKIQLMKVYESASDDINNNLTYANVLLNKPKVTFEQEFKEMIFKGTGSRSIDALISAAPLEELFPSEGKTTNQKNESTTQGNTDEVKKADTTQEDKGNTKQNATTQKAGADNKENSEADALRKEQFLNAIIKTLSEELMEKTLKLDFLDYELTEEDENVIKQLSELVHYGSNVVGSDNESENDIWVQAIDQIIPSLIGLNTKCNNQLSPLIVRFEVLKKVITRIQYDKVRLLIGAEDPLVHLAEVFQVLNSLNEAESYDQVAKWVVDAGNVFFDLSKTRLFNEISNLQTYLVVNSDSNRVDVKVEDLILYLSEKYINDESTRLSFYFTVGISNAFVVDKPDSVPANLSFASEKIGLKYKLVDWTKRRTYKNRSYVPKPRPLMKDLYLLLYGSGLLYQIEAVKTEENLNNPTFGLLFGLHFFNNLDFGIGGSTTKLGDKRICAFTTSFDFPISEYLSRLGKKNKKD